MKKVLVTGGSGFVGCNLVPLLLKRGYRVTVLGRAKKSPFGRNAAYLNFDISKKPLPQTLVRKTDVIIHLAADIRIGYSVDHPTEVIEANMAMLRNVLEPMRECRSKAFVVFASTDRVYGRTKKQIADETELPYPIEPYIASKIMGEVLLQSYSWSYGVPYVVLRMDSVYGPYQHRQMFISDVIQKMMARDEITIGDLGVRKNFVYVGDVAEAFLKALTAPSAAHNTVYNIGGEHASLKEVFGILKKHIEKKQQKKITAHFDSSLVRKSGTEVKAFRLATKKAKKMLGWRPNVSLEKGLKKTIEWFEKNG